MQVSLYIWQLGESMSEHWPWLSGLWAEHPAYGKSPTYREYLEHLPLQMVEWKGLAWSSVVKKRLVGFY